MVTQTHDVHDMKTTKFALLLKNKKMSRIILWFDIHNTTDVTLNF